MTAVPVLGVGLVLELGVDPGDGPNLEVTSWLEITQYAKVPEGVTASRGRTALSESLKSGTLTFTFDFTNLTEGDAALLAFDEFGPLGRAVRLSVVYDSVTYPVWRGFVGEWPYLKRGPSTPKTVDVVCYDVLTLYSKSTAPVGLWDTLVENYSPQPDRWWKITSDGWYDKKHSVTARHTGGLEQFVSPVYGGAQTWGQKENDGVGVINEVLHNPDSNNQAFFSFWYRCDDPAALVVDPDVGNTTCGFFLQNADVDNAAWKYSVQLYVLFLPRSVYTNAPNTTFLYCNVKGTDYRYSYRTFDSSDINGYLNVNPFDGENHHFLFKVTKPLTTGGFNNPPVSNYTNVATGPFPEMYVDGVQVQAGGFRSGAEAGFTVPAEAPASLGGNIKYDSYYKNYAGVLDEFLFWEHQPSLNGQTLATFLHQSGSAPWVGDTVDERLAKLTELYSGLPNGDCLVGDFQPSGLVVSYPYSGGVSYLELFQQLEDTEQGRVWVDTQGKLRFSNRGWAWTDEATTATEFSDDPGEVAAGAFPFYVSGLNSELNLRNLVNSAEVSKKDGKTEFAEDLNSVETFGRQTASYSDLLLSSDSQSRSVAEWLVYSRKTPRFVTNSITLPVSRNPELYTAFAATVEEGTLLGLTLEGVRTTGHVVGLQHDFTEQGWFVTFNLDSTRAPELYDWFSWGSSTWGGSDVWTF
jgi:hypothetical protein